MTGTAAARRRHLAQQLILEAAGPETPRHPRRRNRRQPSQRQDAQGNNESRQRLDGSSSHGPQLLPSWRKVPGRLLLNLNAINDCHNVLRAAGYAAAHSLFSSRRVRPSRKTIPSSTSTRGFSNHFVATRIRCKPTRDVGVLGSRLHVDFVMDLVGSAGHRRLGFFGPRRVQRRLRKYRARRQYSRCQQGDRHDCPPARGTAVWATSSPGKRLVHD